MIGYPSAGEITSAQAIVSTMNTIKTTVNASKEGKKDKAARTWNRQIDLSRDRSIKASRPEKRGGSARQSCHDRKVERLQLQSGSLLNTKFDDVSHYFPPGSSEGEPTMEERVHDLLTSYVPDQGYRTREWLGLSDNQLNVLESTSLLARYLYRAETILDVTFAFATYFKLVSKTNLVANQFVDKVIAMCSSEELQAGVEFADIKKHFDKDSLHNVLRNWSDFKSSPLADKFLNVAMHSTVMGLYDGPKCYDPRKFGALKAKFKKEKFFGTVSLIECCIDMIDFVGRKFYDYFVEKVPLREILMNSTALETWFARVHEHMARSDHLSDAKTFDIDLHQFLDATRVLWSRGDEYLRYCEVDGREKELVRHQVGKLKQLEYNVLARFSTSAARPVPFCVCIEGHSGVGKSSVAKIIHNHFGKIHNKPLTGDEIYVRNPAANFWDDYTSNKWSAWLDDVACWKADIGQVDESVMDIIRMINNVPFMPDQASLEDKGRTPFMCELVVLTTNVPDLGVNDYFNYPYAAGRRVPIHIRMVPKPDLVDKISLNLDKVSMTHSQYDDNWLFTVYTPTPITIGNDGVFQMRGCELKQDLDHTNMNMKQLLEFISIKSTSHRAHQRSVMGMFDSYKGMEYCEDCKLPNYMCSCASETPQLGVITSAQGAMCMYACIFSFFYALTFLPFYSDYWVEMQLYYCRGYIQRRLRLYQEKLKVLCGKKYKIPVLTVAGVLITGVISMMVLFYRSNKFECEDEEFPKKHIRRSRPSRKYEISADFADSDSCDSESEGPTLQGNALAKQAVAPPSLGEEESFWRRDEIIPSTLDSSAQSLALKGQSPEAIRAKLVRSTAHFTWADGVNTRCHGINIVGIVYILPNHCVPFITGERACTIVRGTPKQSFTDGFKFIVTEQDLERFPERDIVVGRFRCLPCGQDVREYFIRSRCKTIPGPAEYLSINRDKEMVVRQTNYTSYISTVILKSLGTRQAQWWSPNVPTQGGDCGMMLYRLTTLGVQILGIHQSFDHERKVAGAIDVDYEFVSSLNCDLEISSATVQLGISGCDKPGPIKAGSVVRSISSGVIEVYGNIAPKTLRRSRVEEHIMFQDIIDLGFKQEFFAPNLSTDKPWKLNIQQLVEADCIVPMEEIMIIKNHMLQEWIDLTPQKYKDEICILDLNTVVNGVAGRRFIDSINKNSSMGYPYNKQKRLFLTELPPNEDHQHPVKFHKEIVDRFNKCCNNAVNGVRNYPIFRASLKDEALPLRKIKSGKVRVFMGAPIDFTLLMRSALLSFIRVAQLNRYVFEGAPGIEAQGKEWGELFEYLTQHGTDRCIFGDFAGFDTSMRSNFMLAAFELIEDFHKACGASEEHLIVIRSIAQDVTFPMVEYHGDLVRFNGINPSGQALTVTLNSIVNCMYMRYCYLKLNPAHEILSFRKNVKLMTYGDDNGMGVSEEVSWFNHTKIASVLASINVTYTMADKVTESKPYISIHDADFLKRKWRWEDDLHRFVCPLDVKSIIKSLMIGLKSKHLSSRQLAAQIVDTALAEFFWHGKDLFDEWYIHLSHIVEKYDLAPYLPSDHLLTWGEHVRRYKQDNLTIVHKSE